MFKRVFLICVGIICYMLSSTSFASEPCINSEDTSYDCYTKNVAFYCENNDSPWKKTNLLVIDIPTTAYPSLTVEGLKQARQSLDTYKATSSIEQNTSSKKMLYPSLEFLQAGHEIYHANMNRIFACAMINSRTSIITEMLTVVNARFGNTTSEVVTRLEQEKKKLENLQTGGSLKCSSQDVGGSSAANTEIVPMRAKLLDSATYQYCVYRYYLDYLNRNVNYNINQVQSVTNAYKVTNNAPSIEMRNTSQFASTLDKLNRDIKQEVELAKKTFPIALTAFTDMERTFGVHIILTLVYDDYIELRKNLRDFLNPLSQLFYKVLNAQSANNGS